MSVTENTRLSAPPSTLSGAKYSSQSSPTESVEGKSRAPLHSQKKIEKKGWGMTLLVIGLVWTGAMLALYPGAAKWVEQAKQVEQLRALEATYRGTAEREASDVLGVAQEYNDKLATGLLDYNDPAVMEEYKSLLVAPGHDVMARVRIDSIGVDQPLRHTFSEEALSRGLGHAEKSSLPVGGPSSHAVIGGHRGLATAIGLTDLPEVVVGDVVRIDVLGQSLQYEVVETEVVSPEQADAQPIEAGRDLLTLITCTPMNVNSHRFMVTAERIEDAPFDEAQFYSDQPGFPYWMVWVIGATGLIVGGGVWAQRRGRKQG